MNKLILPALALIVTWFLYVKIDDAKFEGKLEGCKFSAKLYTWGVNNEVDKMCEKYVFNEFDYEKDFVKSNEFKLDLIPNLTKSLQYLNPNVESDCVVVALDLTYIASEQVFIKHRAITADQDLKAIKEFIKQCKKKVRVK